MQLKTLAAEEYEIVAVMDGTTCPVEEFLLDGEKSTESAREGLVLMLRTVARMGLHSVPAAWTHEANKQERVYEFRKGPLRLFYFKGQGRQIAVCTGGVRKKGNKADQAAVAKAAGLRRAYFEAIAANTLEIIDED